jgi:hypothetical protein
MKKNKKNNKTEKIINQNQVAEKAENISKTFGDESPIYLSLNLDIIANGLHLDFVVNEDPEAFMALVLGEEPLGFFDMEWADHIIPEENGMLCMHAKLIGKSSPN